MEFVKYYKCVNNKNVEDELTIGKIYIEDISWDSKGMIGVINNNKELVFYNKTMFEFERVDILQYDI